MQFCQLWFVHETKIEKSGSSWQDSILHLPWPLLSCFVAACAFQNSTVANVLCAVLCSTAFYCTKMCEKSESPSFIFYETKIQQSSSSWRVSLSFSKLQFITPKWIVKITEMLREKNPCSSWQAILHLPWPLLPCLRHKTKWRRPLLKPPHHTLMLRRNRHCLKLPTIWPISWTISPKFILNCLLMISKVLKYMCIDHMAQTIFLGLSHTLGTACKLGRSIFVKSNINETKLSGIGPIER